jgi:RimJ/RimL family protein N-acetyltransferase
MPENAGMAQETLHTDRITLVPLSDEHLEYEVELDSDPEVMRYLTNGRPRSREEIEVLHRHRLAVAELVPGLGFWAGFVGGAGGQAGGQSGESGGRGGGQSDEGGGQIKGEFVGWWILEPPGRADQGPVEGQAELGYRLLRRHWRKGLASEGARELIRYGFENVGLKRIFAETMAVNVASRATMAAIGMRQVRTFHLEWDDPIPGTELGEVEYAIDRERWLSR